VERFVHLDLRGVRDGRGGAHDGGSPPQSDHALRGRQGWSRSAGLRLSPDLRVALRDPPAFQHLWPPPASREGRAPLHHGGPDGQPPQRPRRRLVLSRLGLRRGSVRGHRPRRPRGSRDHQRPGHQSGDRTDTHRTSPSWWSTARKAALL
jgi:hypothetical protein